MGIAVVDMFKVGVRREREREAQRASKCCLECCHASRSVRLMERADWVATEVPAVNLSLRADTISAIQGNVQFPVSPPEGNCKILMCLLLQKVHKE